MKCENFNYSTESILDSVMKSGFERENFNYSTESILDSVMKS